ncbi:MAG: hypothetical protein V3U48_04020 [Rhodospirillales bacterium]
MMKDQINYQRQLAESLINNVGIDEAVYFAIQNNWDGVLAHMPKQVPERRSRNRYSRTGVKADLGSRVS